MKSVGIRVWKFSALTSALVATVLTFGNASLAGTTGSKECSSSTVDAFGAEYAAQAKRFLVTLKQAARTNDRDVFVSAAKYPLRVYRKGHVSVIDSDAELEKRFKKVITPNVLKAIRDQDPQCLFSNWQGIMIGNGEVWFELTSDGSAEIVTINTSVP
jgi:hypothetical protein